MSTEAQPTGAHPGHTWQDIAASAYRAYAASTGNKNFRGDPMPGWDDLPQPIRTAWEAAARQVGDIMTDPFGPIPDEKVWVDWVPPHLREPDPRGR